VCYNSIRKREGKPHKTNPRNKELKMFYWFTFADGYTVCTRGFDRIEKMHEEAKHGKIISKVKA
jgi:hypothetical protein